MAACARSYRSGCRCPPCTRAHADRVAAWRRRRRADAADAAAAGDLADQVAEAIARRVGADPIAAAVLEAQR